MPSDNAITVENLSKCYLVGHSKAQNEGYTALRDVLARNARNFARKTRDLLQGKAIVQGDEVEEFWALQDVTFDIKQGDRVGIIGRNGAGKSTLLKVLSRITEPTKGRVTIRGRVASLLEVGTGFHPELTGRENVFLNGAILGMTRSEIQRKFDEIVAFAEVERFLDTPVKRYSSGMYVRLAFAVAAHLEPEILIVDEVLAVGDAQFQKKCLGKMDEVGKSGRTVLFVSHNMAAVAQLCSSAILMRGGQVGYIGNTESAVKSYMNKAGDHPSHLDLVDYTARKGDGTVKFSWIKITDALGADGRCFSIGEDIVICFGVKSSANARRARGSISLEIKASDGTKICNIVDADCGVEAQFSGDKLSLAVRLRDLRLYPDTYYITLWAGSAGGSETYDYVEDCMDFEIADGGKLTSRRLPRSSGLLFLTPEWAQVENS